MKGKVLLFALSAICLCSPLLGGKESRAAANNSTLITKVEKNDDKVEHIQNLTFDEAAKKRAKRERIPYDWAVKVMKEEEEQYRKQYYSHWSTPLYYSYREDVITIENLEEGYSIQYGVILRMASEQDKTWIAGTTGKIWSEGVWGLYPNAWKQLSEFAEISYDNRYVTLGVTGCFQINFSDYLLRYDEIFPKSKDIQIEKSYTSPPYFLRSTYHAN